MPLPAPSADDFLTIGPRIRVLPIIHGAGDFAIKVREELLARSYDCLAVPLPRSFQPAVEAAVEDLPVISAVLQRNPYADFDSTDEGDDEKTAVGFSYVPIDPCQGVIAGIRTAMGERIPRAFIDMETSEFEAHHARFPDPYALKKVSPEAFAAAILPGIPPPGPGQHARRIAWMAAELRSLQKRCKSILFVCSLLDWPWIRDSYFNPPEPFEPERFDADIQTYGVDPKTLVFFLGELPYVTGLYERGRRELTDDENLSVDGHKEMLIATRERLSETLPKVSQRITPQLLATYFRYVRNLCLIRNRLTPDLYTLIIAAKQTAGDDMARALVEVAREYPYVPTNDEYASLRMSIDKADVPPWGNASMVSRLPGQAVTWGHIELRPTPPDRDRKKWTKQWDPYGMCSWPPEDDRIESFQQHVRDQAKAILGADLARAEKFTASVMDGIDIRETLRNWHTGDLYVKVIPPNRGSVDSVVFLFDVPADPNKYTSRATWYAEHKEESTLSFFATDHMQNMIGPGIAQAEYGGAYFLFPPRPIPEIWTDPRFDFATTLEERLLAAAMYHTRERHVAVVSPGPPNAAWRRIAKRYGRKLIHLPLKRFGGQMVERLRQFHVLNGKHIRSYAADFIRYT